MCTMPPSWKQIGVLGRSSARIRVTVRRHRVTSPPPHKLPPPCHHPLPLSPLLLLFLLLLVLSCCSCCLLVLFWTGWFAVFGWQQGNDKGQWSYSEA